MEEESKKTKGRMKGDTIIWTVFFFLCIVSIVEVFSAASELTNDTSYLDPMIKHTMLIGVARHHNEHRLPILQDNNTFRIACFVYNATDYVPNRGRDKRCVTMVRYWWHTVPALRIGKGGSSSRRSDDTQCIARRRHSR